ncbi:hypothetical protein ARMSODRAFT_371282 [Armillaria solidipes]|uniref:Secreted protein n=1 Tax=Armillaria solidipes TaxID=1076256 RepID=A0A2H3BJF8_9AGAR|nr:hypothetical protein ARMSODRAFT_371282 [Armillaria solidipes]
MRTSLVLLAPIHFWIANFHGSSRYFCFDGVFTYLPLHRFSSLGSIPRGRDRNTRPPQYGRAHVVKLFASCFFWYLGRLTIPVFSICNASFWTLRFVSS